MKVIRFLYYEDLGDKIGAIYYTDDSNKDMSGNYVSLDEYQKLENKYSELFKLLERVDALDILDIYPELLNDIKEALK